MNDNVPFVLKETLHCPNCNLELTNCADVSPNGSRTMRKGKIVICAACSAPSICGDAGLEALTKERFEKLDPQVQQAVSTSVNQLRKITAQSQEGN